MHKEIILLLSFFIVFINCKHFRFGHSKSGNLGAPGNYRGEPLPKAQWFEQKLDHFSMTDLRTWKQRYFVNTEFYIKNLTSPIFLMIGGEGPSDARWMVKGTWIYYAQHFGALCIMLEHRFYGESHPTSDISVKNLAYLSSEQALADLANFITYMNENYVPKGSKWIVFGGSYPGSLAAWMRLKYPHLVHGAVSSSGPLLAKVDFDRYFGVVVEALREKTGNDDCVNQVAEAHKEIQTLIKTSPEVIEKEFRVCEPFSKASVNDMKNFYNSIADDFADVVQYNEDNRISADKKSNNITINTICKLLTDPGSEPAFKKLAKFNSIILDETNQTCLDYSYKNMINTLRNSSWSSGSSGRQWMYQTCTEFGFYQTSSAEKKVFGNAFPVQFFIQQCQHVFGAKFNSQFLDNAVRWTNAYYGALNIPIGRVVYVHGTIDPWHALGITDDKHIQEKDVKVILINGTAHCANMYPSRPSDPRALVQARLEVARALRAWLLP